MNRDIQKEKNASEYVHREEMYVHLKLAKHILAIVLSSIQPK